MDPKKNIKCLKFTLGANIRTSIFTRKKTSGDKLCIREHPPAPQNTHTHTHTHTCAFSFGHCPNLLSPPTLIWESWSFFSNIKNDLLACIYKRIFHLVSAWSWNQPNWWSLFSMFLWQFHVPCKFRQILPSFACLTASGKWWNFVRPKV